MRIFVLVKPNSKREGVEKVDNIHFIVRANAPAKEGKANRRVVDLLSKYLEISKSEITLVGGYASREKVFDVS